MSTVAIKEVDEFIQKLYSREYIIEPRATEIRFTENKSLAMELTEALNEFSLIYKATLAPNPTVTQRAYNAITAAFTHGIVIDRNDIIKKLRQTEQLLTDVEEDMARLEADTKNIRQKLLNCQQVNAELEKSLDRSDSLSKSKRHEAINSHEKDVDNH
jgi:hypothetical protein